MLDEHSRYAVLDNAIHQLPDGSEVTYKRRRFLPLGQKIPQLSEVTIAIDDRLDNITARTLGDPLQFWQVCDANNAMNPFDLTNESTIGLKLKIPIPQFPVAR